MNEEIGVNITAHVKGSFQKLWTVYGQRKENHLHNKDGKQTMWIRPNHSTLKDLTKVDD